ncbi:uncharacterized protein LOC143862648 [Tasmannia lanceolata]|uniref:uncharacterized protein LOC143862648 n=1 Tax=Tasmannia lanceolata TaxID=3420 RepID=UPI0040647F87
MVGQTGKRAPPTSRATRATAPREGRSERLASQVEVGAAVERTSPHSDRSDPTPTPREMRALFQEMTAVVAQFRNAAPALQQHPVEVSRPVQRGESSRRERASPPRDQTRHSTRRNNHSRDRSVRPEPRRQHHRSRSPSVQKRGSKRDPMHGEGSRHRRRSPLSQSGSARSPSAVRSRPARLAERRDDPMLLRIQKIDNRIEELARDHGRPASRIFSSNPPFTDRVLAAAVPLGFKMPQIPQYDGTTDPVDHLQTFRTTMLLHGASDGFLCRALPTTLTGAARDWYSRLKPKSVDNFDDFGDDLARHFMSSRRPRKTTASLMALRQEDGEALKAFVGRFNREALQVPNLDPSAATNALLAGARSTDFRRAVARRNPQSLADLMTGAEEYISVEETLAALDSVSKRRPEEKNPAKPRRDDRPQRKESSPSRKERSSPRPRKESSPPTRERYTPLTASRAQILAAIRKEDFIRWPKKQTSEAGTQDMSRYCRFHKSHGHDTNACIHLKEEIEQLISRGYLGRYLKNNDNRRERQDNPRPRDRSPRDAQPLGDRIQAPAPAVLPPQVPQPQLQPHGVIGTISGGPTAGGTSSSARRTYARQVNAVHACSKRAEPENEISFSEADLDGLILPHDDALVVTMLVANWEMKKILVDNGSSADILYYHAFEQMMIGADRLKPANSDLFGFSGEVVKVEGQIELPVLIGEPPCQSFAMVTFLVVKAKSAYNAILGRPGQNLLRAIPSAYHQKMKFITPGGVGEVRGDQPQSRQCYAAALRGKNASESLPIELYDLRDEAQITVNQPAEDLISIQLNIDDEQRVVQIGSALPEAAQQDLAQFLRANADVFAWTPSDMPGIDPSISTHELGVDQTCKPVRQKRRHFAPERRRAIREEVERLLKADFIREIQYPDWLANVVMVKKSNGKWRTCIDFTDLNKACPKDSYPLPKIDQLIDATAGHELLSFMDAFSGYNQIRMYESDIPKTSFVTDQGTYCYRVMPFGLKNAGATYQRLVNKLFRNQIGRNMEVYVDDMLVKSRSASNHVSDLEEAFQVLREHNMKLNPTKCTFGVGAGKFLGFMVSQRGIEANPEKIKAVMELTPPSTIREVQRLTGLVAALGRFISKSAERCLPFFNAIRGIKTAPWTPECQAAFEELKQYLSSPPLLSTPEPGEELILYLSAGPLAVAAVLIKEESNQQKPIYYVSKVLHDAETRYQRVEKLVCALIMAARKLRPYFQAHTIKVLTGQPLRQILHRPDTSGRLVKWAVELSEFDIKYLPRPAIKAQILADFIAECTVPDPDPGLVAVPSPEAELAVPEPRVVSRASPPPGTEPVIVRPVFDEEPLWEVYVDGSSNKTGCGAGLVLTGPEDFVLNYALRFGFRASNNEAEYEALIAGMNLAVQTRAQRLKAYCDSQLVVCQIQGVYEAREERMIKYLGRVRSLAVHFKSFEVVRIPRAENVKADVLSKLAASGYTALREIRMEFLKRSSIDAQSVVVMQIDDEPCWMDEIIRYLRSGELPGERKEARKVTQRAARFSLDGETLYKRSYTLPYLKCLRPSDALLALQETHEGICGEHLGGKALAIKILLRGLYWPTLRKDALSLVKKCEKCQKFSPAVHQPPVPMAPIISPLPFAVWGMDILGPFPPASGGREFVVVAIDYFTKWVEAEPLAKITEQNVQNFFWKSVVCRFGIPRVLITDNGKQFDSRNFRKFCSDLHIEQRFTSVAHPQTNGQTEVTNRTLLQGIKKRLDGKAGRWADELYHVLWAYRTTPRTATGESPFNLSFGTEAVIPVDIGAPSPRIVRFSEQLNGDGLRANLDLLEEVREESQIRSAAYKQKVSRYHDVKIRPREFRAGHLVLRKASVSQPRSVGKLSPTWEGPYRVKEVIRPGSYRLESLDEQMLPHAWNSRNLRIYYQ